MIEIFQKNKMPPTAANVIIENNSRKKWINNFFSSKQKWRMNTGKNELILQGIIRWKYEIWRPQNINKKDKEQKAEVKKLTSHMTNKKCIEKESKYIKKKTAIFLFCFVLLIYRVVTRCIFFFCYWKENNFDKS